MLVNQILSTLYRRFSNPQRNASETAINLSMSKKIESFKRRVPEAGDSAGNKYPNPKLYIFVYYSLLKFKKVNG